MKKNKKIEQVIEQVTEQVVEQVTEQVVESKTILSSAATVMPALKYTEEVQRFANVIKDSGLNERGIRIGKCIIKTNPKLGGYAIINDKKIINCITLQQVANYILNLY